MPKSPDPRIHGHVKCHDCGERAELREQRNGRYYYTCNLDRRKGCLSHHRYSPDLASPDSIPGFVPLRKSTVTETTPKATVTKAESDVPKSVQKSTGPGFFPGW